MINILVVDDDQDLLEMVELVLNTHGMNATCINRGHAMNTALEAGKPDIILLDIYLGDSDGRNLCRELKDGAAYGDIPVILYSAGNITEESVIACGADAFMNKPFDIHRLVGLIQDTMSIKENNKG